MMRAAPEFTLTSTYHPGTQVTGILRSRITAALILLRAEKPNARNIHEARQELKRARAMLRLLRQSVDADSYRAEDAALRNAARQLNEARDAHVLYQTFARLPASAAHISQASLATLRKLLREQRQSATATALRDRLASVRTQLAESKERIREWHVTEDLDRLTAAMRMTYRKGRACYLAARESHADEDLHAWRRQVKYSVHQLEALGSLAPARIAKRLRRCARLAKLLGRDHDLALLHGRVCEAEIDATSGLHLTDTIDARRAKLQRRAMKLGERLYAAKPRRFRPLN